MQPIRFGLFGRHLPTPLDLQLDKWLTSTLKMPEFQGDTVPYQCVGADRREPRFEQSGLESVNILQSETVEGAPVTRPFGLSSIAFASFLNPSLKQP